MFRQLVQKFVYQLTELNELLQYGGVFLISFIPFVESPGGAIVGTLIGLPVLLALFISMLGNWISIMFVILPFDALLTKIRNRKTPSQGFIHHRAMKARERYDKYGVPGLALIAPLVASAHIAAFTSLVAGASRRSVITWHTISIIVWGFIGGAIGMLLYFEIM